MQKSPMRPLVIALAVISMLGSGTGALGQQQLQCHMPGVACSLTDQNCAKLPTSLAIANGPTTTGPGWYNDGSACGFNATTKKSCGDKLSKTVCNSDSGGGPGTCGGPYNPCPCPPTVIDCCDPTTDPTCGGDGGGGGPCEPGDPCDYSAPIQLRARLAEVGSVGLPPSVERLLHAYAQAKAFHVKARALVRVSPGDPQGPQALAPYEYWASGDRYHIHAPLDPRLGISNVTDAAFDGRHHELVLLFGLQTLLSVRSRDTRLEPIALDNPAFLPLSFLAAKDEEKCPTCEVRLPDLARLDALRSAAPRTIAQAKHLEVPGGRRGGGGTRFAVDLDSAGRVARISHLSMADQVFETVVFEDYRPVIKAGFDFPYRITESRNDEHGAGPWLTVKYVVDKIDVSEALDDSPFRISPDKVDEVWDTDASRFLKQGDLTAAGLCKN